MLQYSDSNTSRIILALDVSTDTEAYNILNLIGSSIKWVKVGLQLFLKYGRPFIENLYKKKYNIFLDLKLYDIPNQVSAGIKSLKDLPIKMLSVHISGGSEMLKTALEAQRNTNPNLQLVGVTMLTSINQKILISTGIYDTPMQQVLRLAKIATSVGFNHLVCSPLEVKTLHKFISNDIILITPGIRSSTMNVFDQKRTLNAKETIAVGANFLVIGRPIIFSKNPASAVIDIQNEISKA